MNRSWLHAPDLSAAAAKTRTARDWFRGPSRSEVQCVPLHVQLFAAQVRVDRGNVVGVPVVQLRRNLVAGADVGLHLLAPARVRYARIDVRPEAVLIGRQQLPEILRPIGDEREAHDRFDRLEAVLPW